MKRSATKTFYNDREIVQMEMPWSPGVTRRCSHAVQAESKKVPRTFFHQTLAHQLLSNTAIKLNPSGNRPKDKASLSATFLQNIHPITDLSHKQHVGETF